MEVNIHMADKVDYDGLTAGDVLAPHHSEVDDEAAKRAEKAGVVDAAYVGYADALKNYEARPDTESIESRLARESGKPSDSDFVRRGESGVAVATTDGKAAKADK